MILTKVRYRRTKKSLNIDCASAMKYSMALQYASGSALDNSHTNTSSTTQRRTGNPGSTGNDALFSKWLRRRIVEFVSLRSVLDYLSRYWSREEEKAKEREIEVVI